jgi:predicted heme/steroid binding protein
MVEEQGIWTSLCDAIAKIFPLWLLPYSLASFALLLLVGCLQKRFSSSSEARPKRRVVSFKSKGSASVDDPRKVFYTAEQVAKHSTRDDLWITIDDKVYDVTSYIDEHRGGDAILRRPGQDNTDGFHGEQHPEHAADIASSFWIGMLGSGKGKGKAAKAKAKDD